jgi:SpoIID/LytB domain protein
MEPPRRPLADVAAAPGAVSKSSSRRVGTGGVSRRFLASALVVLVLASTLFACDRASSAPVLRVPSGGPEIRVRVARAPGVRILSEDEIVLRTVADGAEILRAPAPGAVEIHAKDGALVVGARSVAGAMAVEAHRVEGATASDSAAIVASAAPPPPADGTSTAVIIAPGLEPSRYRGSLVVSAAGGRVEVVNILDLETYLAGVIGAEMPALWPRAALAAQAVASRSYVLYEIDRRRGGTGEPTIDASASFQVYRGVGAEHARVFEVLAETRGEIVVYEGRPFRSYFGSSCGGSTASAALTFGDAAIPPLAGNACGACSTASGVEWSETLDMAEIEAAIRDRPRRAPFDSEIGRVLSVEVGELGADGRVRYLRVRHETGVIDWRADSFRSAIGGRRIRSTLFTLAPGPGERQYTVSGRGWGHGVGLCQHGARFLAAAGETHAAILEKYFPGASRAWAY